MRNGSIRIEAFGGLEKNSPDAKGSLTRSPDLLNVVCDENGLLKKRDGFLKLFESALGDGPIDGIFWNEQSRSLILFCDGKLFAARENEAPELLMEGLTPGRVTSFVMQKRQFFLNGHEYIVLEGRSVYHVRDVAYVPTVAERSYVGDGNGDYDSVVRPMEEINLLTKKFREKHMVELGGEPDHIQMIKPVLTIDNEDSVRLYNSKGQRLTHNWSINKNPDGSIGNIVISGGLDDKRVIYLEAERKDENTKNVFKAYFVTTASSYEGMDKEGITIHIGDRSFNTKREGNYQWMLAFYEEHREAIRALGYTVELLEETINVSPGSVVDREVRSLSFTYEKDDYPPRIYAEPLNGEEVIYMIQSEFKSPNKEGCIEKCRFGMAYGGRNDTRVFVSGNPDMPNRDWMSGLYDPTYFPENGYTDISRDDEPIMGYATLFEEMIVFKEKSIWGRSFGTYDGEIAFPLRPIHDSVGLLAPHTVKMIENMPVGLFTCGVGALKGTGVKDERNIELLDEMLGDTVRHDPEAFSAEYKDFYLLKSNDELYVLNYKLLEWYRWKGIDASAFLVHDDTLYFGGEDGYCYRLTPGKYSDDGRPIESYWRSKKLYFNNASTQKLIDKVYVCFLNGEGSSLKLRYRDQEGQWQSVLWTNEFPKPKEPGELVPDVAVARVKLRKATHFQFELRNDLPDENMPVLSLEILFGETGKVRM